MGANCLRQGILTASREEIGKTTVVVYSRRQVDSPWFVFNVRTLGVPTRIRRGSLQTERRVEQSGQCRTRCLPGASGSKT